MTDAELDKWIEDELPTSWEQQQRRHILTNRWVFDAFSATEPFTPAPPKYPAGIRMVTTGDLPYWADHFRGWPRSFTVAPAGERIDRWVDRAGRLKLEIKDRVRGAVDTLRYGR